MKEFARWFIAILLMLGLCALARAQRFPRNAPSAGVPGAIFVSKYQTGVDATTLQNAINAATPYATLAIDINLTVASAVSITKPMTIVVEAGATLTTSGAQITINANNVTIMGRGWASHIVQAIANTDVFVNNGHTGISLKDFDAAGTGGTVPASGNSLIVSIGSSTDLTVDNIRASNFLYDVVWTKGTSRTTIRNSTFVGNMAWLSAGGGVLKFLNNTVRDDMFPSTTFVIPLQFDSTSSGFGAATDITANGNTFMHWASSQCMEFHTGGTFHVEGNDLEDCYIGISVNPFQVGDVAQDGTIATNTIIASTSSGLATSTPSVPISIGGISGALVTGLVVANNKLKNGNVYSSNDFWGCINVAGYAHDILFVNNDLDGCAGNAIALSGTDNTRIFAIANHMHGFVASSGGQKVGIGVWNIAGQSGYIALNDIDGASIGVRLDVSSSFALGPNNMTNTTTRILNPSNASEVNKLTDGLTLIAGTGTQTGNPPVTVYKNVTAVPSVTTGETDGQSYTMPANTLSSDGQMVVFRSHFVHAANTNATTWKIYVLGTNVTAQSLAISAGFADSQIYLTRTSSSTLRIVEQHQASSATAGFNETNITGVNFAASMIIKNTVTGATTNGDLTATAARGEWWP